MLKGGNESDVIDFEATSDMVGLQIYNNLHVIML